MKNSGAFKSVLKELNQDHCLRKPLLQKLQTLRKGSAIVSLFISHYTEDPLSQVDADVIEEILINTDTSKGITLILDAPGGDALAAERVIQVCRSYTKARFETIVPSRAKSAATMICLGSDKIIMSLTSELGPIDPQVPVIKNGKLVDWRASYHFTSVYDDLLNKALHLPQDQRMEPLMMQLSNFDASEMHTLKFGQQLSESIAVQSLSKGMMKDKSDDEIKSSIEVFIDPEKTMSHGRALNYESLKDCGLNIELVDLDTELWKTIWALYQRSKVVVDRIGANNKLLETISMSYQTKA